MFARFDLRKRSSDYYSKGFKENGLSTEDYLSGNFEAKFNIVKNPTYIIHLHF